MSLRAPKEHGQILAVPSLDRVGALLERNRHLLNSIPLPSVGKPLRELRELARREIRVMSAHYHQQAGEVVPDSDHTTWILAGHQPELFHTGVWYKNFALNHLAKRHQALPLNLVVDTDTAKPALLVVPVDGHRARVPYDRSRMEIPYEERTVEEKALFADLPNRVAALTARWNFEPMLPRFWQEVMRQAQRTPLLGERFAAARRSMERHWGCVQQEVPMSQVCQTEAFAWFGCSILGRLLTFHDAYNQIVRDYRREHGIRSRHHPVPDLGVDGEWLEAPFWAWRQGQSRRGKLFVRRTREEWVLRVNGVEGPRLTGTHPARTVEAWRMLESQGFKIRSRALTTTMFARLFLADLFIHGIGGGIYDELTDRIIERYFEMPAPGFMVLSATQRLPLPSYPEASTQWRQGAHRLRSLIYQPELYITPPVQAAPHDLQHQAQIDAMVQLKRDWIFRTVHTHEMRVERFQQIRSINAQLYPHVEPQIKALRARLHEFHQQMSWNQIMTRRDYSFCLYPEDMLKTFFSTPLLY